MNTSDREIVTTRLIKAPRSRVWKAFVDPQQVAQWWGPNGFTTTNESMEVKPGGIWKYMMHGPDGRDYPNKIIYDEVIEPEKLVYRHSDDGDNMDVSFHSTITLEEHGDKTLVTMRAIFESAEERERVDKEYGAVEGAQQTLGRLEVFVTMDV